MQSYMSFTIVNYNCYVIVHRVTIYWRESNTNLLVSRTRHRLLDVGTNALLIKNKHSFDQEHQNKHSFDQEQTLF